jgi:hypothetical protein
VQFAYDDSESDWLYEATATYMEDKVYDAVDDYLYFVADFQTNPHRTLSWASDGNDLYEYGGSVFLHYLSERFDNDATNVVRGLWTDSSSVDFFDALEDTILPSIAGAPTDMMGLYADFAGYRWLAGSNADGVWSDEAPQWDRVPATRFDSLAQATSSGNTMASPPQKLGARYVEVLTADGVAGDRLTFTAHGETDTSWAVTIVGQPASGAATVTVIRDDDGDGEIVATSENNDQYERVVFAVSNLGLADQNPDYWTSSGDGHTADISTSSFTYDLLYSATGTEPVNDDSAACGCTTARAAPSASWLLSMLLAIVMMVAIRRQS